jgi:cell division protein FtsQ
MGRRKEPESGGGARGRLLWLRYGALLAAVLAALAALPWLYFRLDEFLATDERFALAPADPDSGVSGLDLAGVRYASRDRILAVFAEDFQRSIYLVPLRERLNSLLQIEWVRGASVRRRWPNRLEVRIVERVPVAFVQLPARQGQGPAEVALIDQDGVILPIPERAQFQLPVLKGLRRDQDAAERRVRVAAAMRLLAETRPLAEHFSEIDVTDRENLKVLQEVGGRLVLLHLGDRNFESRLRNFLTHFEQIQQRMPEAATFDLQLDDRITAIREGTGHG